MSQINATIKKDLLGLTRTFRFILIIGIGLFTAIVNPLTLKYMGELLKLLQVPESMLDSFPKPDLAMGLTNVYSELTDLGLLVILLAIMSFIGGEQKKKLLTMPITKGLTLNSYVISKFILFPLLGFLFGFVFSLIGYTISINMFEVSIPLINVIGSSALVGLELMFVVSLAVMIGILTSRPGIGVTIIYVSRLTLVTLLTAIGYNRFNPFALSIYGSMFNFAELSEVIISVCITIVSIILLFVITLIRTNKEP